MAKVIADLAGVAPGGRNNALNHAAWTLGHWVAAGALGQAAVEDALYVAALRNGLVADDGPRQCWATIRSGLSKGLGRCSGDGRLRRGLATHARARRTRGCPTSDP